MAQPIPAHENSPPRKDILSKATANFPQYIEEFQSDSRIAYSETDGKWILTSEDGSAWEWDDQASKWMPSLDQELVTRQQQAYGETDAVGDHDLDGDSSSRPGQKRKNGDQARNGASKKARRPDAALREKKNSAIYVEHIPLDASANEVHDIFSRYGVIAEEVESGKPRIKMYTDDKGNFKGDALVVYFRPESVSIAIDMLDDSEFRPGQSLDSGPMRVSEADTTYKRQQQPQQQQQQPANNGPRNTEATKKAPKPKMTEDQVKVIERTKKLNAKLADWSDEDDDPSTMKQTSSRHDKVVILKHMFTLDELAEDPANLLDIKADVFEECEKLGPVTKVVLFDREADGYMSVRFGNAMAAKACIDLMHGRHFDGRTVEARISDGKERFKKTARASGDDDQGDNLEEFSNWVDRVDREGETPAEGLASDNTAR